MKSNTTLMMAASSADTACPFTTLHWHFLLRYQAALAGNPRMALRAKNVARLSDAQKQVTHERAAAIRRGAVGIAAGVAAEVAAGVDSHA